jgi:PAS domain S-box-containing protein
MGQNAASSFDFRQIIEASADGIWLIGLDGRVADANRCALSFMSSETASGWCGLWPADSQKAAERALKKAMRGDRSRFRSFLSLPRNAHVYLDTEVAPLHDADGAIIYLLATARNVTEQVEETAFLKRIVELMPLSLTVRDSQSEQYILFNRFSEALYKVSAEEAIGKTPTELFPLGVARAILDADAKAVESAEARKAIETEFPTDAGPRQFTTRRAITFDDAGPRHLMTLSEDVTEQRAGANALRVALKAAEQASDAKTAFLANMSHEIRTPLNGVIAAVEMLAAQDLTEKQRALSDIIRSSSDTLHRLLSDILDVARIETGAIMLAPAPFHIGDLVRELCDLSRLEAARRGLDFELTIAPEAERTLLGDRLRLRQIMANLLGNAVKFTETGGISVTLEAAGRGVRFVVADTGVGFDAALKSQIFNRFHQIDSSHTREFGGSGLGLAICQELCALMGAELDCESAPGLGSTFRLDLNLPAAELVEAPFAPGVGAPVGLSILVAEDHPANRAVLELMLESVAQLRMVENGALAVQELSATRFDLILMDMQMPEMDGLDATRAIRAMERSAGRPPTPIIMLTANTLPEHVAASLEAGADLHLAKPVTPSALFGAVDYVLSAAEEAEVLSA